jgi:ABC-type transport system substrate-binding protein
MVEVPRFRRRLTRVLITALVLTSAMYGGRVLAAPSRPHADRIVYADMAGPPDINLFNPCCASPTTRAALFSSLIRIGTDGRLVPELLAMIPSPANHQVRAAGKEVVLRLRPHEYWSSGVEITAQDVRFGWQVGMDPRSGPFGPACGGTCDHIQNVSVTGRYTAILHLPRLDAEILTRDLPPVVPHGWTRLGGSPHAAALRLSSLNFAHPGYWTDGPFEVKSVTWNGGLVLVPMPHYRLHRLASRAPLVNRVFRGTDDMLRAVAAGSADALVGGSVPLLDEAAEYVDAYRVRVTPSFDTLAVQLNGLDPAYAPPSVGSASVSPVPNPLHDVRVRQALALATDHPRLVMDTLRLGRGAAEELTAFTPLLATRRYAAAFSDTHINGIWDPLLKRYLPYGVLTRRDAQALLAEAGYGNGLDLDAIVYPNVFGSTTTLRALATDWATVGVRLHYSDPPPPRPPCFGTYLAHSGSVGHFEVLLTVATGGPDPSVLVPQVSSRSIYREPGPGSLENFCSPPAGVKNFAGIADPRVDAQLTRGEDTLDTGARRAAYDAVQARVIQSAYWIPLYYLPNVIVAGQRVRGVTEAPDGTSPVFAWRRTPAAPVLRAPASQPSASARR